MKKQENNIEVNDTMNNMVDLMNKLNVDEIPYDLNLLTRVISASDELLESLLLNPSEIYKTLEKAGTHMFHQTYIVDSKNIVQYCFINHVRLRNLLPDM